MLGHIGDLVKINKDIIIFGCTETGKQVCSDIKSVYDKAIVFFFDSNIEWQGKKFEKCMVLNEKEVQSRAGKSIFVIAGYEKFEEMKNQLLTYGVNEKQIIFPSNILKHKADLLEEKLIKIAPRKDLRFIVDLVSHCNLNCRCCNHFSPIATRFFYDLGEFEKDLGRLNKLFGNNVSHISLAGGEPLLHPLVCEFMKIARKYFNKTEIQLLTNGLLLPKMEDEFWDSCKKYQIGLLITPYPIDFNYSDVVKLAKKSNVNISMSINENTVKTMIHEPLDLNGKRRPIDNFMNCNKSNNCITLKHGKLYTCTLIPSIEYFNKFYNKNLEILDEDGIDIYSDVTMDDILIFLATPPKACRYCQTDNWKSCEWEISKRNISEWV